MPAVLLACFVVSGASGLVLEVVWSRWLTHVFGSTTLAISTVLATFMGGLALGSWLGGKLADRLRRHALLVYAGCELGVALLALAIPLALRGYDDANAWLWRRLVDHQGLLGVARFLLCAALLLPPTTLMGATLPVLARWVVRTPADFGLLGRRVGALYAANTFGAVLGAGGAGFYLIPTLGARRTNLLAAAADVVLAILVAGVVLLRRRREPAPEPEPELPAARVLGDRTMRRVALGAFALSGAVAMTLEVLWSRALALVIGSSVYSFTLILVVFLVGLAAGAAFIGRRAAQSKDPLGALALVFLGVAASVALTHRLVDDLPNVFVRVMADAGFGLSTLMALQTLIAGVTVAPAAACLGAVMPLCVRAYAGSPDAVGRDVGRAYAANTAGAIAGSFAGGFVVLPMIGLDLGVRACAFVELALAGLLATMTTSRPVRRVAVAGGAAVALLLAFAPRWDASMMTSGVFRIPLSKQYAEKDEVPLHNVLYYRDGVSTTVSVEGHGDLISLKNNGKTDASSWGDMPTQILLGLTPVLLHGGAGQRAFVVGYGSGVTVGAIAESPDVARVDVAEIEPAIYEAADRFFGPYNHRPDQNPRVRRFVGDARHFLAASGETYDVIVSEPSNPWMAGVASLFTREFYGFARRHLAPGGIFCQWVQIYEIGPRNLKTIYRTFQETFPHVYAFTTEDLPSDTLLIGTVEPLPLDLAALEARVSVPAVATELERGGVRSAADLLGLLVVAPDELAAFAAGGDINTDDNALLEFSAPRDLLASATGERVSYSDAFASDGWPYGRLGDHVVGLGEGADRARREGELALALLGHGKRREAASWLERAVADGGGPAAERALKVYAFARRRARGAAELALDAGGPPAGEPGPEWFDPAVPRAARESAALELRGVFAALRDGRPADALRVLEGLPRPGPTDGGDDLLLLRAYLLYLLGDVERARAAFDPLVADAELVARRPAAVYYHARLQWTQGAYRDAVSSFTYLADSVPGLAAQLR